MDLLSKALQVEALRQEQEEKAEKALDAYLSAMLEHKPMSYKVAAAMFDIEWHVVRDLHRRVLRELAREEDETE